MNTITPFAMPSFDNQAQKAQILPFPQFGRTAFPIETPNITVGVKSDVFDSIFKLSTETKATITLVPKSEEALESMTSLLLKMQEAQSFLTQFAQNGLLNNTTDKPKPDDKAKDFAFFEVAPLKKQSTKKQTEEVSAKNTTAMINAFKRQLGNLKSDVTQVTAILPEKLPAGVDSSQLIREMATLSILAGYNYDFDRTTQPKSLDKLASVILNKPPVGAFNNTVLEATLKEGQVLGHAMNLTRHLVDSPANRCTPQYFAEQAKELESSTMTVNVLKGNDLEGNSSANNKRMGLFLSVAQGNNQDNPEENPRLVEMVHTPKDWDPTTGKTVMIVGKGITFDTGGSDLKPSEFSHNMRGDMAGAGATLGVMKALDDMPVGVRVIALMPLTPNRIGGKASLPQDIYTARSGKEVYIANTDAEGRLVLADAMHYGLEKYNEQLDAAFTIATLTGGKTRAIGLHNAVGISGNNNPFLKGLDKVISGQLRRTTKGTYPLEQQHYTMVTNSSPADVQNASGKPAREFAGIIKPGDIINAKETDPKKRYSEQGVKDFMLSSFTDGAAFLQAVAMDPNAKGTNKGGIQHRVPWGHFDIAGAEFGLADPKRRNHEWATGIGVEDLYYSLKGIGDGSIEPSSKKTRLPKFEA